MSIMEKKAEITPSTPPPGYVHWYINADGIPEYVDESGDIHGFHGPAGPPGPARGPAGPAGANSTVPGPPGAAGGLQWAGAWQRETTYPLNAVVNHNGGLYVAVATNTATDPATDADADQVWALMLAAAAPAKTVRKARAST